MESSSPPPNGRPSRAHRRGKPYRQTAERLGLQVRAMRQRLGWTLQRAAEAMDLDLKHLQKIESGALNVTLVTLVRLATGLGTDVAGLFRPSRDRAPKRRR